MRTTPLITLMFVCSACQPPPAASPVTPGDEVFIEFTRDHQTAATIDLGSLRQGERAAVRFSLRNSSGRPFCIRGFCYSCPCLQVLLPDREVATGEILDGRIEIDMGREPDFVGALLIEAEGRCIFGAQALVIRVSVDVRKSGDEF